MSAHPAPPADHHEPDNSSAALRTRRRKLLTPLSAHGEPMVWLAGGALSLCVCMVVGLLALVLWMGMRTFWPSPVELIRTEDGQTFMGEIVRAERYAPEPGYEESLDPSVADRALAEFAEHDGQLERRLLRTGNYDLTNQHFRWIDTAAVAVDGVSSPDWALVIEREEWGRFYGYPRHFLIDGEPVTDNPDEIWKLLERHHDAVRDRKAQREEIERRDLGALSRLREDARLAVRDVELEHGLSTAWTSAYRDLLTARRMAEESPSDEARQDVDQLEQRLDRSGAAPSQTAEDAYAAALDQQRETILIADEQTADLLHEIDRLNAENAQFGMQMESADGEIKIITLDQIVRAYPANQLSFGGKLKLYIARWWEYLTAEPREANSEGGVFPAIVGTILMTIIMAVLVVPFGVLAAMYLREYAKSGVIISAVRIAINNLAGVPSIVFGVFGLGFFCYGVGGFIDGGPAWKMPSATWFILLIATTIISIGGFIAMLASTTKPGKPASTIKRLLRYSAGLMWFFGALAAVLLIATTPFFDGFYRAGLPNPTFGKGALVWGSFTLALLTLPVVIVATEEALAAVPNSMREGSYACGASKWQTIRRIVMPRAMPGIMTGMILAMARGAGEVAPLMLVGAVKLAPELPMSLNPAEQFGVNRSFMHLGFHIYDLGFQSQNSEAAKPLVFTTTLLLILIIALLNVAAIGLRSRLRRKFVGAKF